MQDEHETQREVVRLVLARERELHALERLLGAGAVAAAKTLAADGIVIRHGEQVWASSALSRLAELELVTLEYLSLDQADSPRSTSVPRHTPRRARHRQ